MTTNPGPPPEGGRVVDLLAALEASVLAAKAARAEKRRISDSLDVHDARHPYLDNDDPEVKACLWCQS